MKKRRRFCSEHNHASGGGHTHVYQMPFQLLTEGARFKACAQPSTPGHDKVLNPNSLGFGHYSASDGQGEVQNQNRVKESKRDRQICRRSALHKGRLNFP